MSKVTISSHITSANSNTHLAKNMAYYACQIYIEQ